MFNLRLLGSFESNLDDRTIQFRTDKIRALMAYLAVESSVPLSKQSLATLLWGNTDDKNARTNLRVSFHRLRQAIDKRASLPISSDLFESNRQTIQLVQNDDSNYVQCDALLFDRLIQSCESHQHQDINFCSPCLSRLEQAVGLYQGEFLNGIIIDDSEMFDEWLLLKREAYHQQVITALNHLIDGHLVQNKLETARTFGQKLLVLEPWHETIHRKLMLALALMGQREAAIAQYEACRQSLWEELGVEPDEETAVLYQKIINNEPLEAPTAAPKKANRQSAASLKHNLPSSLTPYFGREKESAQLTQHLLDPDTRFLTLLGEGGIGKSRLSLEVGRRVLNGFADGVWFVPLSGLSASEREANTQDEIATAIAQALNHALTGQNSPKLQIVNFLKSKHLLLILDNFEHLMSGSELVIDLLTETAAVSVLCSSRIPLGFMAEYLFPLRQLPTPKMSGAQTEGQASSSLDYAHFASVQLFEDRARRTTGWFELNAENQVDVATICDLVAGNPLGIELTAASLRQHSLLETIASIQASIDVVSTRFRDIPQRHRSMRAVFENSWSLLSDELKGLLAQLSVFRGGFLDTAVTAVTGADRRKLKILHQQSLLTQTEQRFSMHELLRQFAEEKLLSAQTRQVSSNSSVSNDTQDLTGFSFSSVSTTDQTLRVSPNSSVSNNTQDPKGLIESKHSRYFLTFLADRTQAIAGEAPQIPAAEITAELDNIREAWRVAAETQNAAAVLESLNTFSDFLQLRGRYREAERLFGEAAALFEGVEGDTAVTVTARLLVQKTAALVRLSRYDDAITIAQASLEKAEQANDPWAQGYVHLHWGEALWRQGEYSEAINHIQNVIEIAEIKNLKRLAGSGYFHLNIIQYYLSDYITAKHSVLSALDIWGLLNNNKQKSYSMNSLGLIHFQLGNLDESRMSFEETLRISEEIGDLQAKVSALNNLSMISTEAKDFLSAGKYLDQSLVISKESGDKSSEVIALLSLGWNSLKVNRFSEARKFLALALNLAKEIKSRREEGLVLKILGDLHSEEKDFENAQLNYQAALLIAESLNDELLDNDIQESRKKYLHA
ncbi:MAG: BTAD domain-containing putative transcriptional regulator [Chloroflexota bacterium]